jgi:hypothetical protein
MRLTWCSTSGHRDFIMPVRRRAYSTRGRYSTPRGPRFVQDAIAGYIEEMQGPGQTTQQMIVAGANVNGVRRVARFDLNICTNNAPVHFALVYIPEGIQLANASLVLSAQNQASSLYIPEQHIILSGVISSLTPSRYVSYQSRSLASGDQIYLLMRQTIADTHVGFRCSFVVAFG